MSTLKRLLSAAVRLLSPAPSRTTPRERAVSPVPPRPSAPSRAVRPGGTDAIETVEVDPPAAGGLTLAYAPQPDGEADAGEIVWTWVPYAERDGRGKDRPVLVIARQDSDRVYAMRLTSSPREGDRGYLALGAGEWDATGRASWLDTGRLYSVHVRGLRREAAGLDRERFRTVAAELGRRYGWAGKV